MKNRLRITDDDRWRPLWIATLTPTAMFVFAVHTTGIFCRPSCRAKQRCAKMSVFMPMPSRHRMRVSPL